MAKTATTTPRKARKAPVLTPAQKAAATKRANGGHMAAARKAAATRAAKLGAELYEQELAAMERSELAERGRARKARKAPAVLRLTSPAKSRKDRRPVRGWDFA